MEVKYGFKMQDIYYSSSHLWYSDQANLFVTVCIYWKILYWMIDDTHRLASMGFGMWNIVCTISDHKIVVHYIKIKNKKWKITRTLQQIHDIPRVQYIPRNMHTVFALLCFVVVIHWLISPYPSGLLHWHCGNLTIAPVPAKQPW